MPPPRFNVREEWSPSLSATLPERASFRLDIPSRSVADVLRTRLARELDGMDFTAEAIGRAVEILVDALDVDIVFTIEDAAGYETYGGYHFTHRAHHLLSSEHTSRIAGDLREDGREVWDEYLAAKADKGRAWGKFCGVNNIDKVVRGIKRGELWLHAAFTGELKTTFALNWAYNLVTRYRSSVFYVTLEMPYEQIRAGIYVMHSANPRFASIHAPLDYEKVKSGTLTDEEEAFFKVVIDDFTQNDEYGRFEVWGPDRAVTVADIKLEAELRHQKEEIGLLVIDHGLLVAPSPEHRRDDYGTRMNSVIREAKQLALHFNHGEKIPVLLLFQINREGKDQADKAEGRYKLRALSYANEAERSADLVSTTYLNDQHRRDGTTLFDCLKRRDGQLFQPFVAAIDWRTRRLSNVLDPMRATAGISVDDYRSTTSFKV
jgi:hypothetical protein